MYSYRKLSDKEKETASENGDFIIEIDSLEVCIVETEKLAKSVTDTMNGVNFLDVIIEYMED